MDIRIKWFDGKYPSFNVSLASAPGRDEFLTIKGCRLVNGTDGQFVSYPAQKKDDGKYWNHVWASEKFNEAVLAAATEDAPEAKPAKPSKPAPKGRAASEDDGDVPF